MTTLMAHWIWLALLAGLAAGTEAVSGTATAGAPAEPVEERKSDEGKSAVKPAPGAAKSAGFSHAEYDALLRKHVRHGEVDYAALQKERARLDAYLERLGAFEVSRLSSPEQIAFYINAYNAYTLQEILEHYPGVDSIRDISRVWSRRKYRLEGKVVSLEDIEHGILRKRFEEPRIHFALVCASKGCPYLRPEAYVGDRLDEQLDDNARVFFQDPARGVKTGSKKGFFYGTNHYLHVTKIFKWFDEDFTGGGKSIVDHVERYAPEEVKKFIREHRKELSIRYLDYDWSLNDRKREP